MMTDERIMAPACYRRAGHGPGRPTARATARVPRWDAIGFGEVVRQRPQHRCLLGILSQMTVRGMDIALRRVFMPRGPLPEAFGSEKGGRRGALRSSEMWL